MSTKSDAHQDANPVILIAEDHAVLRRSLHDLLAVGFPNAYILEAENGEQAFTLALSHRPDAVLMDISMPGTDGFEATRRIKKNIPDTIIIILTIHEDPEYRASSAKVGANAFMLKRKMGHDLIPALSDILSKRVTCA